ncbi:type VI secretion system protein TssA [Cocleimonas flava]|uniref:Type VI secretion system protein ImpA n=1 Tax=Cocleimonas flava TaxID=634765 RepID=A0A4R1F4C8_9GAMM|nr:type VI secretion system protein TssA [Cocleimonas flava]TCJ87482.1 type VI secretion system protein ImpA [Cocleimonas flava]
MLDVEAILVDHEGDTACGENLEYDPLFLEVRSALEGKPEQRIGEDVIEGEEPDWKLVKKNCLELCKQTHSLEVVISLTQALINLEGYAGLADGSKLLSGMVEKYWGCVHPEIDPDDNDPTERLNMLALFEDFNFLLSLQKIELLSAKGVGKVSLYDLRNPKSSGDDENETGVDALLADAIFKSSDLERREAVHSDLEKSIENFQKISSLLKQEEHVGDGRAPNFAELLKILKESKSAIAKHLDNVSDSTEEENLATETDHANASENITASVKPVGINTRSDVISAIEKIEDYYHKNEPGSPIPLILQRAKSLVDKDFLALMEDLAPDSLHQVQMIVGRTEE